MEVTIKKEIIPKVESKIEFKIIELVLEKIPIVPLKKTFDN